MSRLRKPTRITVSLPDDEHAALAAMAERHDVSLSWLTRKAVIEFLERYERAGAQLPLDLSYNGQKGKGR
tara:strand:+ start:816 stop:1025 length:210 start_codon:yes stop_codon:yes gene_type:complete